MSAPYGQQPPAPPPPGPSRPSHGGLDLGGILALVAAGLGLIIYLCCFAAAAVVVRGSLSLVLFLGAGLIGAATLLPNGSRVLLPAAVLSTVATLTLLVNTVVSPFGMAPPPFAPDGSTPGIVITILVFGFLQTGALVSAVLLEAGLIGPKAGGGPARQPSGAAQSPAPHGQYPPGQYAPPPGPYQYPPGRYGQYGHGPPEPPGGYGQQGPPSTAQYAPGPQQQGQHVPPQVGQYAQPGPPYQAQYGQQGPPQQGQYGAPAQQGQQGSPGAYGQYEQQPPDSGQPPQGGQPDHGEGTARFSPPDPDQRDEPGEQDSRRRYGRPEGG